MKKQLIFWLMQRKLYRWLLKDVIPYIRFTTYYPKFPGWKFHRGYALLEPGDIIVTDDSKKLTSVLIPGNWAHAALCVDIESEWEISEMTHEDYRKSTFFDICKESDRVAILRCTDWDPEYVSRIINKCKSFEGTKYDGSFTLGVVALYCSELVYESDVEKRLQISLDDLAGLGVPYISPDGLYNAKNVKLVWISSQEEK